jgi:hypothetical protein
MDICCHGIDGCHHSLVMVPSYLWQSLWHKYPQIDAYIHNISSYNKQTRKTITRLILNQINLKNRWYEKERSQFYFFICPHSNPIADFIKLKQLLCTCFQHCEYNDRNVILVYLCVCVCAASHYCHCFHSNKAIVRERNCKCLCVEAKTAAFSCISARNSICMKGFFLIIRWQIFPCLVPVCILTALT